MCKCQIIPVQIGFIPDDTSVSQGVSESRIIHMFIETLLTSLTGELRIAYMCGGIQRGLSTDTSLQPVERIIDSITIHVSHKTAQEDSEEESPKVESYSHNLLLLFFLLLFQYGIGIIYKAHHLSWASKCRVGCFKFLGLSSSHFTSFHMSLWDVHHS